MAEFSIEQASQNMKAQALQALIRLHELQTLKRKLAAINTLFSDYYQGLSTMTDTEKTQKGQGIRTLHRQQQRLLAMLQDFAGSHLDNQPLASSWQAYLKLLTNQQGLVCDLASLDLSQATLLNSTTIQAAQEQIDQIEQAIAREHDQDRKQALIDLLSQISAAVKTQLEHRLAYQQARQAQLDAFMEVYKLLTQTFVSFQQFLAELATQLEQIAIAIEKLIPQIKVLQQAIVCEDTDEILLDFANSQGFTDSGFTDSPAPSDSDVTSLDPIDTQDFADPVSQAQDEQQNQAISQALTTTKHKLSLTDFLGLNKQAKTSDPSTKQKKKFFFWSH